MDIYGTVGRVSTRPLVLLVCLLSALVLALVAWHTLSFQAVTPAAGQTTFHLREVGGEQVAHNRSEQALGSSAIGREQVAHNRSEEGLQA